MNLSEDLQLRFEALVPDVASDPEILKDQLELYRSGLRAQANTHEFLDLDLALALVEHCMKLLDIEHEEQHACWVEGAIRYLLEDDDAIPDTDIAGFDDDAQVFNHACDLTGHQDLRVSWL